LVPARVTFVNKYAKEIDPITGKRLDSTDIDFIIDDGVDVIYYQTKKGDAALFLDGTEKQLRPLFPPRKKSCVPFFLPFSSFFLHYQVVIESWKEYLGSSYRAPYTKPDTQL
jgi:hypothetical protein